MPGIRNLHPADATLNLPLERHSHGLRKLAALEAARGSFRDATDAIERSTGVRWADARSRNLAMLAAVDFEEFYETQRPTHSQPGDPEAVPGCGARSHRRVVPHTCRSDLKTARFCAGLLEEQAALWTFREVPGITPTNNDAERAMRGPEILRRISGGPQSERGNRWIERILSIIKTCCHLRRPASQYSHDAIDASLHARPIPILVPG